MASPKLFALMNDADKQVTKRVVKLGRNQVPVRAVAFNQKEILLLKLNEVAEVNQGISTGQNDFYIRRDIASEGYEAIDYDLILTQKEIKNLTFTEHLNGVDPKKYQGRYFVPFDKGSESDANEGWMPNYYVPTRYFIKWSKQALTRMRTLTIEERKIEAGEINKIKAGDDRKIAAALRNSDKWFKPTICFSPTGQYSPSFRLGASTVSQNTSSTILLSDEQLENPILGVLSSILGRFFFKNYHNHTVHTQEGDVTEFNVSLKNFDRISSLVAQIIAKQKANPRYDYASHEQIEIDRLVYEAYGLNDDDIQEVETWYARRYPKLAGAQARNRLSAGAAQATSSTPLETETNA